MKSRYADIPAYITKDGSEIRELMHPAVAWQPPAKPGRGHRGAGPRARSCIAMP
jgi:hypothetical protein